VTQTFWRVEKAKYAGVAKTGEGARLAGGRWTSPGQRTIYCAEHLSLAILEVLVHAPDPTQRSGRIRFHIRCDRRLVERLANSPLPPDFSPRTPYAVTRTLGDEWLQRGRAPVLSVPSAIVPTENNYLLNPDHPAFGHLSWDPYEAITLDDRLWTVGQPRQLRSRPPHSATIE